MKLDVINLEGGKAGSIELNDAIFGIDEIRGDIPRRCVNWQPRQAPRHEAPARCRRAMKIRAPARRCTSKEGHRRRLRHGSGVARPSSSAALRGSASVVRRPRRFDLPKKVRALALRHALSSKIKAGTLMVLDTAALDAPKTAGLRAQFAKLGLKNALVIAGPQVDPNFQLAARNIPQVDVLPNAGLNVYDVLRRDTLVLTRAAIEAIEARFAEKEAA